MNYRETIDFLFSSLPMYQRVGKAAYKANLNNTHALDKVLQHPHKKFRSIHIAGTNGKGSVSHILASVFQEAGYKTGLYTSPHLLNFRERIRINGRMIGEEDVVNFVHKISSVIEDIEPSFFEITVAMAFDYFALEEVDIAIIETGMGGRLDSTNIIQPEVSIITSISMDHTEFLGNTKELIAREKGGIIKKATPVITGINSKEVIDVLTKLSIEKETTIIRGDRIRKFKYLTQTVDQMSLFHFHNTETNSEEVIKSDLGGAYQAENIAIALASLDLLNRGSWNITAEQLNSGLSHVQKNTSLRGRWEILGANPRIICDTAHNEAGISAVMEQLKQTAYKKLHIIWGMVEDKPLEKILTLLPANAIYYFSQPSIPRGMAVDKLIKAATTAGLKGNKFNTVEEAFNSALSASAKEDMIYIGGSTFMVADLLNFFERSK